jgi:tetratricopeptide (TPR) repeat protein
MKYALLLGCTVSIVAFADGALAKAPTEVENIARSVTVEIKLQQSGRVGSGIIVHRQGDLYTVVTNRHVVCGQAACTQLAARERYILGINDGTLTNQRHQVTGEAIQLLGTNLDLAIIQFRSTHNYEVATVSDSLKAGDLLYTAGFPANWNQFYFGDGRAVAVVNRRLTADKGGYSIVYNVPTLPGMSGGGVFNSEGQLVAIHGFGDRYKAGTEIADDSKMNSKFGYNRGIPVLWLVQLLNKRGITLAGSSSALAIAALPAAPGSADEHFISGFNKFLDPGTDVLAGKQQAIQEFDIAIGLNPKYAIAYFMRGYVRGQLKNSQQAIDDYNQAITLDPNDVAAYGNRGNLKYESQDLNGAIADYNRAIEIDPKYALAYYNRARLKKEHQDTEGALADYSQAIVFDSRNANAYNNRGNLRFLKKDLDGALSDYDRAIVLEPQHALAYGNRGLLKKERKDLNGAMADYNKSIQLNAAYAPAYHHRGQLRSEQKDFNGSLEDFNQAIALDPTNAAIHVDRGSVKHDLKDLSGAMSDYDQAIRLDPKSVDAYNNRGILKYEQKDWRGALADYDQAITLAPNRAITYVVRAVVKHQNLGDTPGGIADLSRFIELNPDFIDGYYNRGDLLYTSGNTSAAIADFQKVAKMNNSSEIGLIAQGIIDLEEKSIAQALISFGRAAQLNPNAPDTYKYRGLAYRQQGDRAAAVQDWQKAAQLYQQGDAQRDYAMVRGWLQKLNATE